MAYWFNPPGIKAGGEVRVPEQVVIQWLFLHDLPAGQAAILAGRVTKGPRKKRTRPEPRQYNVADLERARDRVAAAERRIGNERKRNPEREHAGLRRAQLELSVIESQLRLRDLLEDQSGPDTQPRHVPRHFAQCVFCAGSRSRSHRRSRGKRLKRMRCPNCGSASLSP
jgi:hypothetical protein